MVINIKRAFVATLLLCGSVFSGLAQQDLMVSQQLFSRINVNPAGTGNNDKFDLFLLGRMQWAGVENSPKTGLLNFTGYSESLKSSLGLTVNYDKIGVGHSATNAQLVYAYHVDLTDKYILSMGLSGGANWGYFNPAVNIIRDESELSNMETYTNEKDTEISPDANFGLELTTMNWMVGASCTHLLKSKSTTYMPGRHYYAYARGFFPLCETFDVAPALIYMHKHKTNVLEANVMAFYNRFVWGGATWKPDLSDPFDMSMLSLTLGFEWHNYRLGYTYDLNLGKCNNLPSNTHELLLSVQF
ncbi:MAG: type IX secretion system membrane protein PorP/SprF [Paludibacteraceae bacterium]|nr:type IX secretion system membrane protein PorP/SprF [Paludibacteraceae bacterium]MBR4841018.1 type IX secretion system membrane protein PorP/SprF [Paludibacteraceae bacterium]